ncbi:MAG: VWA domain-containing protein [Acidobacteriota bacterium]
MKRPVLNLALSAIVIFIASAYASAQTLTRELKLNEGGSITVVNLNGRVEIIAKPDEASVQLVATSSSAIAETELKIDASGNIRIETEPAGASKRIDLSLTVPERVKLKIQTRDGEIRAVGDFESVEAKTDTGTIAADVPTDDLKYDFFWTSSRPRYLSDIELKKVKERSGGKFQLKGKYSNDEESGEDGETRGKGDAEKGRKGEGEKRRQETGDWSPESEPSGSSSDDSDKDKKKPRSKSVELTFTTARGIVLLNIPPNEVSSDLRERPLTNAAKAIIRSGDLGLMDSIRRASPKYFGDYARTLPPMRREPTLTTRLTQADAPGDTVKEAVVRVTDIYNRSIPDLRSSDFIVAENGALRDIISVKPHTAPVNLVLLLDVSGSVDNYVNFIRKAARAFIDTARDEDRISLILFNDDVKVLSGFSTNKAQLSESLDTFDAAGATGYYDAVAFTLADTLRPLRGERTAIVVLTDGDDNRSFLSFESLIGAIEESGALIYPLYVPSALIAASESNNPEKGIDPLRRRYMTLSARAEGEGERLAKVSGGVYYPITQLSQIQRAYDDIVTQIRTAYSVTFRSAFKADPDNLPSPRLKIRVNKPSAFVQVTSVRAIQR